MGHRHAWLLLITAIGLCQGCQSLGKKSLRPTAVKGDDFAPVAPAGCTAEARELPPTESARACVATADALYAKGNTREAIAFYEKARQADPSQKRLCRRLAVLYDREDDYQQALVEYKTALEMSPKDAALHNDVGYCHYCRGQWAEAEKELRRAVELDPAYKRAWVNLGLTLAQEGRGDQSLQAFQKAIPPAQAQANLAFILTAQGKMDEAKVAYDQALRLDPQLKRAREARGRLEAPEAVASAPAAPTTPQPEAEFLPVSARTAARPATGIARTGGTAAAADRDAEFIPVSAQQGARGRPRPTVSTPPAPRKVPIGPAPSPYAPVFIDVPQAAGDSTAFPPPPVVTPERVPAHPTSGTIMFDPE